MDNAAGNIFLSAAGAVLAENVVFSKAFGVSTMITAAKNKRDLAGTCLGVCWFTLCAGAAGRLMSGWGMQADMAFTPLIYAAVIGVFYAVTLVALRVVSGRRFGRLKKYVHISAFNSTVMGTIFLSVSGCESLGEFLLFGLSSGAGFGLAAVMLSGVYGQLCSEKVPGAFRGFPAIMLYTGLIAMAVYGLGGRNV
ncbi:MAG: hypothetical protein NC078_02955 [Ruminococcus sp.]|nr:hypothetical protein [Ruminococcus sp.]